VIFHSYTVFGERLIGGTVAVQCFYIISGFYMALILNEKYKKGKGSYKLFITNRFLRIYPLYWVCLFLVLLMCVVGKIGWNQPFYLWYWTSQWSNLNWTTVVIFIFANIFLFGSDWICFTGVNKSTGMLTPTIAPFAPTRFQPMACQFLFIPQIWSVGVEITFYLIAPLLLRGKWYLQLIILIASLSLRYNLYYSHFLYFDPWDYRFFPNEIAFFMAGSLAYQIYSFLKEKKISKWINSMMWGIIIFGIIFYPHIQFHIPESEFRWVFYLLFWICLPFIFLLTARSEIDRMIGELSYPIYVSHHFVMFLWRQYFFSSKHSAQMDWFGITCVISTLIVAIILYTGVVRPIEKFRQRRVAMNLSVA
jgi:peptidoglycan/LPS O-acetylase OafA/YrhL